MVINGILWMLRSGRSLVFEQAIYAHRTVVERCINWNKQWRGLATCYEKRAAKYRAMVVHAVIVNWIESRRVTQSPVGPPARY